MRCGHCGTSCDEFANYCSRCGAQLRGAGLPALREVYTPTPWQGAAPVVAQGVAALAAGTLLRWGLRWMARRALWSRPPLPAVRQSEPRSRALEVVDNDRGMEKPEGLVSEMVYYRKVIIRRM